MSFGLPINRLVKIALVATALALTPAMPALARSGPASVAELARDLSAAVVNIGTTRMLPGDDDGGMPFPEVPDGSPLEELFDGLNPNSSEGPERMREARSLGSGFIISADGLIVTNNHVIEGANEILVFLTDGTRLTAELVGADEKTDLAVLRINADHPLTFVEFGDSDNAQVGDWVMAIGNPFGLGGSVTLGIVSARNRDINAGPYDNFIQTDAAINQGNSGGPLFDMDGKVVGINTAIISRTGGGLGIGFAVPGNLANPVIMQLAEFGETRRGWLGVGIQEMNEDIASSLGRTDTKGALVVDVSEPGPSIGILQDGDLILEFDGKQIARMRDLPRVVAETDVGKEVVVKFVRRGKIEERTIQLGRLETANVQVADTAPLVVEPAPLEEAVTVPDLGALVGFKTAPLDAEQREAYGIVEEVDGVVITEVFHDTDADDKGLIAGLVIEEVNQSPINTVEDVTKLVDQAREEGRPAVLFKISDPTGVRRFIAVRLQ